MQVLALANLKEPEGYIANTFDILDMFLSRYNKYLFPYEDKDNAHVDSLKQQYDDYMKALAEKEAQKDK